jgi:hypothetical protein
MYHSITLLCALSCTLFLSLSLSCCTIINDLFRLSLVVIFHRLTALTLFTHGNLNITSSSSPLALVMLQVLLQIRSQFARNSLPATPYYGDPIHLSEYSCALQIELQIDFAARKRKRSEHKFSICRKSFSFKERRERESEPMVR